MTGEPILFDFPDLHPGDVFRPAPDASITARWLPIRMPWLATALIEDIDGDRLVWTEENRVAGRRFTARATFVRVSPTSARLRIEARLGRLRLPPVSKRYVVVAAERNLIAVRAASDRADMVCLGRQTGRSMIFHLRLPLGIAIHKRGTLETAR